jgi:hypothetical protein
MKFLTALIFTCVSATAFADDTPPSLDPNALQQQSWQFYTRELDGSMGVGSCIVRVTVTEFGRSGAESIQVSSTLQKLDSSCLQWVHYFCWLPAMRDGHAIESNIGVRIDWLPTSGNPPVIGRVFGVPKEIFKPKPGAKSCITPRESERAWMP